MSLTIALANKFDRKCGGCTLCCKLLPMSKDAYPRERVAATVGAMVKAGWSRLEDFAGMKREWDKPAGKACQHQRHGKGCAIYKQRPFGCRIWNCRWLTGDDTADLSRPDRSHYVIDLMPDFITLRGFDDGTPPRNIEVVQIWVDQATPDAWREPACLAYIERRAAEGKAALIRLNENTKAITVFAPAFADDGQWHEIHGGELRPQHVGAELINGLTTAKMALRHVDDEGENPHRR